jgi:5-methylcytosine-specific restriction enzyme subunit McrC
MSREIPIANIYYLLCYAWDALEEKNELADAGALESPDLLNLFARVLASGTHRLLHRGLDRGYLPREEELAGVRGKLLASPTLRRHLLQKGRAMCAWDELEYDTLPNRILKTTLVRLSAGELESPARAAVREVLRWLAPISTIDLSASYFRRVQLHRNNRIYTFLLHVCEFVHEHWLPDAAGGPSRFRDFVRDGLPDLFEKFVFNFYAHELRPGWTTSAPHIAWQMSEANADARALVPLMMTDVCLRSPRRAIILDTKFYAAALTGNAYGSSKLRSGHLYQLFAYLRHRAQEPGWENAEGVLLYPRVERDFAPEFVTHGHRIRALTLDLRQCWQNVECQLLAITGARDEIKAGDDAH